MIRIGAQSAFIDNTLQRKGAVPYDSEKAAKQVEVDAQRVQQEQIDKKKLTIPEDIEFKLQQKQLLQKQQKNQSSDQKADNQLNSQSESSNGLSPQTNPTPVLINDDLPISKKAISAYESTATLEKRQEIAELVGFDGFA